MAGQFDLLKELGILPPKGDEEHPDEETRPPREEFVLEEMPTETPDIEESDAHKDYKFARNMLYTLANMSARATHRSLQVAEETEHPRAFEAFNSLVSSTRELTRDLITMQKEMKGIYVGAVKKVDAEKEAERAKNSTTIPVFATSTADLLRDAEAALEAKEKGEED